MMRFESRAMSFEMVGSPNDLLLLQKNFRQFLKIALQVICETLTSSKLLTLGITNALATPLLSLNRNFIRKISTFFLLSIAGYVPKKK